MRSFVDVSWVTQDLTVREAGRGPTVWYLHDEVSARPGPVAARLTERCHVVAPVHPGFGGADRPEWIETVPDLADHYLAAVRSFHRPGEPLVLIGSSLGAWIATELALLLTDLAPRLVLIGPLGLFVPGHQPADHWFMTDDERDATLYHDVSRKPGVPLPEFIANEAMTARVGWNPRLASRRLAPRLSRLRAPVLTIWGRQDALLPAAHRTRWGELLPQSASLVLDDCGHYPVYERPVDVAEAITRFALPSPTPTGGVLL
jgi:pimeloyl-ACP methyl ester carboxylesterase